MAKKSLKKLAAEYHLEEYDEKMQEAILLQLRRRATRRKLITLFCTVLAVGCLGYFAGYYYLADRSGNRFEELAELKNKPPVNRKTATNKPEEEVPEILDEYKKIGRAHV